MFLGGGKGGAEVSGAVHERAFRNCETRRFTLTQMRKILSLISKFVTHRRLYVWLIFISRTLTKLGVPLTDTTRNRGLGRYEDFSTSDEEDMEGLLSRPWMSDLAHTNCASNLEKWSIRTSWNLLLTCDIKERCDVYVNNQFIILIYLEIYLEPQ